MTRLVRDAFLGHREGYVPLRKDVASATRYSLVEKPCYKACYKKKEYKDLLLSLRQEQNLCAQQMSIFFAVDGGGGWVQQCILTCACDFAPITTLNAGCRMLVGGIVLYGLSVTAHHHVHNQSHPILQAHQVLTAKSRNM